VTKYRVGITASVIAVIALAYAYADVGYPTIRAGISGNMEMVGIHMPMLTATAADSLTPKADYLPDSRWTATTSSQPRSHLASNAHSITIYMHAVTYVSGLTYLPRHAASYNGDIGQYSISVSINGKHWNAPVATGTWGGRQEPEDCGVRGRRGSLRAADRTHRG
jgi:F5/8 type C domain